MLKAVKHAWTVDKLTSGAFVGMWREPVADLYSKYMATAAAELAHQSMVVGAVGQAAQRAGGSQHHAARSSVGQVSPPRWYL
jgi:hypothetical protein